MKKIIHVESCKECPYRRKRFFRKISWCRKAFLPIFIKYKNEWKVDFPIWCPLTDVYDSEYEEVCAKIQSLLPSWDPDSDKVSENKYTKKLERYFIEECGYKRHKHDHEFVKDLPSQQGCYIIDIDSFSYDVDHMMYRHVENMLDLVWGEDSSEKQKLEEAKKILEYIT